MKKLTTTILLILFAGMFLTGCDKYTTGGVEQYVIDGKICTSVWWQEKIAWSKCRDTNTSKDTLRADSIEAERIYKTIKSLK